MATFDYARYSRLLPDGVFEKSWCYGIEGPDGDSTEDLDLHVMLRRDKDCAQRSLELLLAGNGGVEYLGLLYDLRDGSVSIERYEFLSAPGPAEDGLPFAINLYLDEFTDPRFKPFLPILGNIHDFKDDPTPN